MAEIRVETLRKQFKDIVALDDITFRFPDTTVTCLLGPSGCGKTTLMRIIAGLEKPTGGEVYFGDERVTHLPTRKRDIGMVFQYPVVYRGISVWDNIELPLKSMRLPADERRRRISEIIEILGLQASADKDMTQLDNGTRQKVAVARAVARQPRIILFDEPITNVDSEAKLQLKRAFKELTRRLRQTIVYVTHDQTEAMTLADQIALMQDGKIVQCAEPRMLYNEPADRFGGWFLGNPGMGFIDGSLYSANGGMAVEAPVFAAPVRVQGLEGRDAGHIIVGIRPERVQVGNLQDGARPAGAIDATLERRTITTGRQYLLTLAVGETRLKAKVAASSGERLPDTGPVWVELPLASVMLFDPAGHRLPATFTGTASY